MKVFFDGSARPNPGFMETAVVTRGVTFHRAETGMGDSNDAEWLALLHAVEVARRFGATEITLLGDSALVIGQASGVAPCRDERFRAYLALLQEQIAGIGRVRIRRIRRAQNLAGIALEQAHGRL